MKKFIVLFISLLFILTGCGKKEYVVTIISEDGDNLTSFKVNKGENIKDKEAPKKEGYIFVSWLKDGMEYNSDLPIKEDITLVAKYTLEPKVITNHTVKFNFGNEIKSQTVKDGELVTKPKDPVKDKHVFIGWYVGDFLYNFNEPVTKDISLVAKYERNKIIITYDLDGGTGALSTEITAGTIPEKPKNPSKFGYNFIKWTINGKDYNFDTDIQNDTTIKAVWEAKKYVKVVFDTDGGSELPYQIIEERTKILPVDDPKKEGYIFKYFTLDGVEFDVNTPVEANITLKAVYEEIVD